MSSPLSVKRRKLNDATNTLKKPFVSPLRSAKIQRTPLKENSSLANQPYTPSTLAHTVQAAYDPSTTPVPIKHVRPVAAKSTPIHKQLSFTTTSKRTDPAELAAQRALTALELQIKGLRNELDTLKQAAQISRTTTDEELAALTDKWKVASQQAAEELFGTVKERVCRMGGVAAWRESEKRKHERAYGIGDFAPEPEVEDDADCEFDSRGEELPEEEQEFRKREKRRARREAMDAADVEEKVVEESGDAKARVWQEEGKDDDVSLVTCGGLLVGLVLMRWQTFTMDMMLRSLHIELKVIGYDKVAQRWKS